MSEEMMADASKQRLLLRRAGQQPSSTAAAIAITEEKPPACQPSPSPPPAVGNAPASSVAGADTTAIRVPASKSQPRRRWRVPVVGRTFYTASDWYVGAGLFVLIAGLAFLFFAFVVPAADQAILMASRPHGHDAYGYPEPLPRLWLNGTLARAGAEAATPGDAMALDADTKLYGSDSASKRRMSAFHLWCLEASRAWAPPFCAVIVVIAEIQLVMLLICDPGIMDQPSEEDEAEEQRGAEAYAAEKMKRPMPPEFGPRELANVNRALVNEYIRDARWRRTLESDIHRCSACKVDVLGYDHHCGVVGACIGRTTMPLFVLFLLTTTLLLTVGCFTTGVHVMMLLILHGHLLITPPLVTMVATMLFTVTALYLGLYVAGLSAFYVYLGLRGEHSLGKRYRTRITAAGLDNNTNDAAKANMMKSDSIKLCGTSCRWSSFADMMSGLSHLRLSQQ